MSLSRPSTAATIAFAVAAVAVVCVPGIARSQSVQRGVVIVRTYCVKCHAIDKISPSPLAGAPPLRDLEKKYPLENLQESFAEGIVTGHPSMPEYRFDADQIGDLIAFLKSLR